MDQSNDTDRNYVSLFLLNVKEKWLSRVKSAKLTILCRSPLSWLRSVRYREVWGKSLIWLFQDTSQLLNNYATGSGKFLLSPTNDSLTHHPGDITTVNLCHTGDSSVWDRHTVVILNGWLLINPFHNSHCCYLIRLTQWIFHVT